MICLEVHQMCVGVEREKDCNLEDWKCNNNIILINS